MLLSAVASSGSAGRSAKPPSPPDRTGAPPPPSCSGLAEPSAGDRDHEQGDEVAGQHPRRRPPDRAAVERPRPAGHAGEVVAALAAAHRVGRDGRPAQRARRGRRRGCVELCAQVVLPRLAPAQRDDRRSAASTVLLRSMARVVGPTPPRRGVIQDATSATDSSTSGITRRPSYVAPALTTAAPGLTMSGVTMPAWPAAPTRMSAVRVYSPRSPTPVWTTVTAALALGRLRLTKLASGRPTVEPRPAITTWRPPSGAPQW